MKEKNISEKYETLNEYREKINNIKQEIKKIIIWQDILINNLIITLLSWWHIILEWVPWLAKTLSVQALSQTLDLNFSRIQFTPDLLPSDLLWWQMYNQAESKFYIKKWPIFTNFLLADEINRSPAKVQSALLEAMQEKSITISDNTYKLDSPFIVLATQNPIEQEWTYPLPEAQLDRFLLKTIINYPSKEEEILIMKNNTNWTIQDIKKIMSKKEILTIQNLIETEIYVDNKIYEYVKNLVFATRNISWTNIKEIQNYISFWASPRASIWLIKTSKVCAFLSWRDYVIPEDIKNMAYDILRHRIWLTFDALWENITTDNIIKIILENIIVP
jgi:MoxR-like ATPase